jgi:hypothetical protein
VSLQVDHVQVVEQLRTEVDSLKQQLQHAQSQHMELTHMPSCRACSNIRRCTVCRSW